MQVISEGSAIAAELMLILSAPASKIAPASSNVRTPPPTVNGTNSSFAVRLTVSINVERFSCVAVMSSNTISSAPAALCAAASSAGSPALRRLRNCVPLTTRPASTSRQAMIRLVNISFSCCHPEVVRRLCGQKPLESRSKPAEILQHLQSRAPRFFRVKLHSKHIVLLDCCRKSATVFTFRRCIRKQRHAIRMREIDERPVRYSAQQARFAIANQQAIPSHVRRLHSEREAAALARPECEAVNVRRLLA